MFAFDDPNAPPEKSLPALDDYLAYVAAYRQPSFSEPLLAAGFLAYHKLQPERVFEVMKDFDHLMDQWHARMLGDNLSAEEEHIWTANEIMRRQVAVGYQLIAARIADQPERAAPLKPFIERDLSPASGAVIQEQYWHNRARLAALEGRKAAALTYYQKALLSEGAAGTPKASRAL
jgi:hypothetical protein